MPIETVLTWKIKWSVCVRPELEACGVGPTVSVVAPLSIRGGCWARLAGGNSVATLGLTVLFTCWGLVVDISPACFSTWYTVSTSPGGDAPCSDGVANVPTIHTQVQTHATFSY